MFCWLHVLQSDVKIHLFSFIITQQTLKGLHKKNPSILIQVLLIPTSNPIRFPSYRQYNMPFKLCFEICNSKSSVFILSWWFKHRNSQRAALYTFISLSLSYVPLGTHSLSSRLLLLGISPLYFWVSLHLHLFSTILLSHILKKNANILLCIIFPLFLNMW